MPRQLKETKSKQNRRGNNEGSIYKRKDKDLWCGQAIVGHKSDGKPVRKTIYGKTRQDVARKIARQSSETFNNGYVQFAKTTSRYFNELFYEWFTTFKAPTISSATKEKLLNFMNNHIFKEFGKYELQHVDLIKLQQFFNKKSKELCDQSIKHIKQFLNQFFTYAVKKNLVNVNPVTDVQLRAKKKTTEEQDKKALSSEERKIIFAALEDNVILKPILLTYAFTGLRPGELIALRWKNIDFENSTIFVSRAINREIIFDENDKIISRNEIIGNTKTAKSTRAFKVPQAVMDSLKTWREHQESQELKKKIDFTSANCFVFTTKTGTVRKYSGVRSHLVRFLKKNRLGKLRHKSLFVSPHFRNHVARKA